MVHNMGSFYSEELLAPLPTSRLEDHPLLAVRDCLFNVLTATLHIWRLFLHRHPEDAPCHGDRDPLIMAPVAQLTKIITLNITAVTCLTQQGKANRMMPDNITKKCKIYF
jgi:hypothetical protein